MSVSGGGRRSVTVGVVYRPPSLSSSDALDQLYDQLQIAVGIGKPVFCVGDFNIDLLCPTTPCVRRYLSMLNDLSLYQLITSATHLEPRETLLDHIVTSEPNLENAVIVPPVPIADHLTIIVRAPFTRARSNRASFYTRPWRKINWDALSLHLLMADWDPMYRTVGAEGKLDKFMHVWSSAIDLHCPLKKVTPRRPHCPWVEGNQDLLRVMAERDRAFQHWRTHGEEHDLLEYRRLRNNVKACLARAKRDFLCSSLLADRASFWRNIKKFALRPGSGGDNAAEVIPAEVADDFNRHFATVGSRVAAELKEAGRGSTPLPPRPPCVTTAGLVLQPATLPELSKAISQLSSSKAVGVDGVPLHALKKCFPVVGPHLLHLINTSITSCVFPCSWKLASVVPLHKSGSRDSASNFRPISILSVLSKLCEKIVCMQLSAHLVSNSLLAPSQYAYRPCHSTEDAMIDVVEWMTRRIDKGHVVAVTSIDLSKAFDSVDHDVLLTKLRWHGIDHRWFQSYLDGRRQVVRGGSLSLTLSHGVPQGSLVGPILFSIFTNDLPSYLPHGRLMSYADDTQLLDSAHPDQLDALKFRQEETLAAVQSYFTSNSLKMNPTKTTLILVGTPNAVKKSSSFQLNISNCLLTPAPFVKTLGVTIDRTLSWETHISNLVKKCNAVLFCIYKLRHHLTPETRKLLIDAHVFPHILYCLSVWGGAAACHLTRVQKVLNFAARVVSGTRRRDHITPVLEALGWRKISDMVTRRDRIGVFRAQFDPRAPVAIRQLFTPRAAVSERVTRSTMAGALEPPDFRLSMSRRAFSYRAAMSWNFLPSAITAPTAIASVSRSAFISRLDTCDA